MNKLRVLALKRLNSLAGRVQLQAHKLSELDQKELDLIESNPDQFRFSVLNTRAQEIYDVSTEIIEWGRAIIEDEEPS